MNELYTYALPGSCRFRMCIMCGVDHKGAEFFGDKHTHSLTNILSFMY